MLTHTDTYEIQYDVPSGRWEIIDVGGICYDVMETQEQAVEALKAMWAEDEAEHLGEAIACRLNEARTQTDLATLRKVAELLGL